MPDQPRRAWIDVAVVLVVLLVALAVLATSAAATSYANGEGSFLRRARFFDYFFVKHDLSDAVWRDSDELHTQPMLVNFIVGGWLRLRGFSQERLDALKLGSRDARLALETYRELGLVTDLDRAVRVAREPMVGLAVGVVVLLYLVGRLLGGLLSGVVAAGLGLLSPLAQEALVRAKGEAPLMFCVLLALLVAVLGARRGREGGLPWLWAVGLGVVLGLGVQAKLTAVLSLAAVVVWAALMVVLAVRRGGVRAAVRSGRGWALATVVALVVFVISNPHLYPNPPLHAFHLFAHRAENLTNRDRDRAVHNPLNQPRLLLEASLISQTFSGSRGVPLEALLAPLGAAVLVWRCWTRWRSERQVPLVEGLVLITVAAYFAGVTVALQAVLPQYYVPTLVLGTLLSGLGLSVLLRRIPLLRQVVGGRGAQAAHTPS